MGVGLFRNWVGYGTSPKVCLVEVPQNCREPIGGLHNSLRPKPSSLLILFRVRFNLNGLHNNAVHISGFRGEDGRIVELNVVSVVDTVFSYGGLLRMFPLEIPLILL
jgi:hypothetical protein